MKMSEKYNKWKERFIVTTMICLILVIIIAFQEEEKLYSDLELCQATTGVPAYVSIINGELLFTGYKGVPGEGVIDYLIKEQIAFVYATGCPYCAKQIEDFGEEWIKYQESGLTVDCAKL